MLSKFIAALLAVFSFTCSGVVPNESSCVQQESALSEPEAWKIFKESKIGFDQLQAYLDTYVDDS